MSELLFFEIPDVRYLSITGPDAERYLHGRITQDVKRLKKGSGACSLVLTPNGRIQGQFLLLAVDDGYLLATDRVGPEEYEELRHGLWQFRVADRVEDNELTGVMTCSLQGDGARAALEAAFPGQAPVADLQTTTAQLDGRDVRLISFRRGSEEGVDLVLAPELAASLLAKISAGSTSVRKGTPEELERMRILAGLPRSGAELTEKVLAPEIDLTNLVALNKGCYAGQEVVEMATARGRPNRYLARIRVKTEDTIGSGSEVLSYDVASEGWKSAGVVTSATSLADLGEQACLAFLKSAITPESRLGCNGYEVVLEP